MTVHPIGVHIGPGLTDDNELLDGGPLARAAEMDADGVQVFLTDPQSYKTPKPRPDAGRPARVRRHGRRPRAVHAQRGDDEQPHPHPRPQAARRARHGRRGDRRVRPGRPRRARAGRRRPGRRRRQLAQDVRLPGRRTAASRCRCSSRTPPAAATPWPATSTRSAACSTRSASSAPASCSTPATPGPPAGTWTTVVDDVRALTGRIDLVHLNNSRDPHGLQPRPARPADRRRDPDRATGRGGAGRGLPRRPRDPR